MASVSTQYKFLERNPKSNYKQLFVRGTRIFARTLYGQYMSEEEPRTPEEIAADFGLPIEAVREAIAYCDTDPIDIREDFAREEAIMDATGMNDPDYKPARGCFCRRSGHGSIVKLKNGSPRSGKHVANEVVYR